MTTKVVIALGTNDDKDTSSLTTENVKKIIESLKTRGYDTFVIIPPNKETSSDKIRASRNPEDPNENFETQHNAVKAGASAAGESTTDGTYSITEPWHLTAASAAEIRSANPDALVVGDHNAVRINGFKSTEVCKTNSTSADILRRVDELMPDPSNGATEDGNNAISITAQDKQLLDMVTKNNLEGTTYYSYYLGQQEPRLTEWTLEQVQLFQARLLNRTGKLGTSSAVGKYQMIKSALKKAYEYLGLDPKKIRFTEEVQDALMIARLEDVRKLKEWKAGQLPDRDFCIQLGMEFDSVPVPKAIQPNEVRQGVPASALMKGQSFYSGEYIFTEGHNLDAFLQSLSDLRKSGPRAVSKVDVTLGGRNSAAPPTGRSYKRTAEIASTGGNRVLGGRRVNTNPNEKLNLPTVDKVFEFQNIDPQDDRYDFRTGKQVKDIGINETKPVLENEKYTVNGNDPLYNAGNAPEFSPVSNTEIPPNNTMVDFETQEPINPTQEQKSVSAQKIVTELKNNGISDQREQANILAVIENTSRLSTRTTKVYSNASNTVIRRDFGSRVSDISDQELTSLKQNNQNFYDTIYDDIGGNEYRGRGFIQVTGRENYVELGSRLDLDLDNNPDLVFEEDNGAKIAADFYSSQKDKIDLASTRNLYTVTNGYDPYLSTDPLQRSKGIKDLQKINALSDTWYNELERQNPTQITTKTSTNIVQLADGGLKGVSDKPLPTGRSTPAPTNNLEITESLQAEIDAVNDSPYNELLAEDYLGETATDIIDKTTGQSLGKKPDPSKIKYDTFGDIFYDEAGKTFAGNGSGAIVDV